MKKFLILFIIILIGCSRDIKNDNIVLDSIKIEKENITEIEERPMEDIIIDGASGESIPPITKGKRGFPNRKTKELTPKYDYEDEFAFREKEKK